MPSFLSLPRVFLLCVLVLGTSISAFAARPLEASEWQRPTATYSFALYFTEKKGTDPEKRARELAADPAFGFSVIAKPDSGIPSKPALLLKTITGNVEAEYKAPTLESLRYFGRGLNAAQAEALQKSPQVLVIGFIQPARDVLPGLLKANTLALRLAIETQGLIWDEETREVFTPDYWKKSRVDTWEGAFPNVARHITMHAYNDNGKVRAVTLGMSKFALPDLSINDAAWSLSAPLGHTLNATAQQLIEGARPDAAGQFNWQLANLKHAGLRQAIQATLLGGGLGQGQLVLHTVAPHEGDAENAQVELGFENYRGKDVTSRQTAFVTSAFGALPDDVVLRKGHDAALAAASERARSKLPALKAAFQSGLQPGEVILLKAPFKTASNGTEWMWVEVVKWPGERISAMLRNEPRYVPGLTAGQIVEVKQSEIFDYIRRSADGKQEGNETSDILSKTR